MNDEKSWMQDIIRLALAEDRVTEDVTTQALMKFDRHVRGEVIAKEQGVISGIEVFRETFRMVDDTVRVEVEKGDGDRVASGDRVARLEGRESSILRAERTALNFLQRLSGVATTTRHVVEKVKGRQVAILDTRKTTPGMRYLEKQAVKDGGGRNHRRNLRDMAMVKDNHIQMAGTITRAVEEIRHCFPEKSIEVEVRDISEFDEAHSLGVNMIMLDNFSPEMTREAVGRNHSGIKIEVSGNVTPENVVEKAIEGVDFISMGSLTHSFKSLDLSLEILPDEITGGGVS